MTPYLTPKQATVQRLCENVGLARVWRYGWNTEAQPVAHEAESGESGRARPEQCEMEGGIQREPLSLSSSPKRIPSG